MTTNAYLERMNQLNEERVNANKRTLEASTGLPIQRPNNQQGSPSGVPTGEIPKPEEDESYKQSPFYQNFDNFKQNDPHFGGVVDELTKLATGLREQVKQGFMPQQIAEDRLKQFVSDTSQHFTRKEPELKKQAEQEQMMKMLGALSQGSQQQNQPQGEQEIPPEGLSQEQAMQQQSPEQTQQPQVPTQQGGM